MNREEFVRRVLNGEDTKQALCREYGISRPTGDKWIERYTSGAALEDQSRRPFHTPNRSSEAMEQAIVALREKHPVLGAAKLRRCLQDQGLSNVPCSSTINAILHRHNQITPEASKAATPWKRFAREKANELWQADFKGHFPMKNGEECHPLNILDDATRYSLCCEALLNEQFASFQPVMIRLFRKYGMPEAFLSDNGNPWGNGACRGYSYCDVWMMQLGILPMHSQLHHPQTQGKEERFNQSQTRELLVRTTIADQQDAQAQFSEYRTFYNTIRPHHALGLDTPSSRYSRSEREYPEQLKAWEYGSEERVIRVHAAGHIRFDGREYYLGEAFRGERIALAPSHLEDCMTLTYRQFRIARINLVTHQFVMKRPQRLRSKE